MFDWDLHCICTEYIMLLHTSVSNCCQRVNMVMIKPREGKQPRMHMETTTIKTPADEEATFNESLKIDSVHVIVIRGQYFGLDEATMEFLRRSSTMSEDHQQR